MSGVLVTDGELRASLAVVRSLGASGDRVRVTSGAGRSLAGRSRFALSDDPVPDPRLDPDGFVEALRALAARWDLDVVLPISEASLRAVLPRRSKLPGLRLPFPDAHGFELVSDKALVLERARKVGVPTLPQRLLHDADEALGVAESLDSSWFPAAVKSTRSVMEGVPEGAPAVRYATDARELTAILQGYPPGSYPLLLQRRIEGPGVGVFLFLWNDGVRARFQHRRVREKPPSGGCSVCCEAVPVDPELADRAARLLWSVGWRGVAMVEFKVDNATGETYLLEVNGRFWGSLQLAIDAGVDFPLLLVEAARGRFVAPTPSPWRTVRLRWIWGEVDHLYKRLTAVGPERVPGSVWDAVREVLRWRRGDRTDVFRLLDPWPFLHESRLWLGDVFQRPSPTSAAPASASLASPPPTSALQTSTPPASLPTGVRREPFYTREKEMIG